MLSHWSGSASLFDWTGVCGVAVRDARLAAPALADRAEAALGAACAVGGWYVDAADEKPPEGRLRAIWPASRSETCALETVPWVVGSMAILAHRRTPLPVDVSIECRILGRRIPYRSTHVAEQRIPDPTLMARLQLSVKGVDWAASLVKPWQHEAIEDVWSAHHQVAHLIAVETENFQPRIRRILAEDRPELVSWDTEAFNERYRPDGDIDDLAERFMAERTKTVEMFKSLSPDQWLRTGIWPDSQEVDLAWLAEKVLWHALDHFAVLLDLHGEFEKRQARRWMA